MDLFLSSQSVGLAAVVAAGCMVAAGATSNRWTHWWTQWSAARRDARIRREAPLEHLGGEPPTDALPLSGSHHVAIAGRLRVEGSACARLEDAACAAVSTFYLGHESGTHAWSVRARELFLEVKGARVRLEGPVLVEVGSEEHFPGASLLSLRGRVLDRVGEALQLELPVRRDLPSWGSFRSLTDGDEIVVTGWLERGSDSYRRAGAGATLRPVEDEPLVASCRRRPIVRGPLGRVAIWASALVVTR